MHLTVNPPILPMLANRVAKLPPGEGWIFEPKWDGFRTLIFRDGDELFIQSRDEKPLDRYFPELVDPLKAQLPTRCVLDVSEMSLPSKRMLPVASAKPTMAFMVEDLPAPFAPTSATISPAPTVSDISLTARTGP